MSEYGIESKAMVVNTHIATWSARKYDRKVSKEVDAAHETQRESGRFNKILIDLEALRGLHNLAASTRKWIEVHSSPWFSKGGRIITPAIYFEFTKEIRARKEQFWDLYSEFEPLYPALRYEAKKDLRDMFNIEDYPPVDKIRSKFGFSVTITPMPKLELMSDWRVGLGDDEVERIRKETEEALQDMFKKGVTDLWDRLHKVVNHAVTRLSEPEPKNLFESMIGNIIEVVGIMSKLNYTNDPALEHVRRETERTLATYDIQDLRKHKEVREQAVSDGRQILKNIKTAKNALDVKEPQKAEKDIVSSMASYM